MSRGNGRVFTRKGSSYFWIGYYAHGKEQREVARHVRTGDKLEAMDDNRQQAERFLKHRLGEVVAEKHGGYSFVGPSQMRVTVGDLLDSLKSDLELRGKWNDRVDSTVKKVREKFGTWKAVEATSEVVADWQLALREDEYRDATINRFCQILGQAFKLGIERKRVSTVPIIKHLSEVGNERKGFFSESEIRSVITHLPDYLKDFILFAYITGMRRGEIKSLRWSDVHEDAITLRPENSKNGEARTIPLEGELEELIERCKEARKIKQKDGSVLVSEYIFHDKGQVIGEFRKAWATACCMAGVGTLVCPSCGGQIDANYKCEPCGKEYKREQLRYTGRIVHDLRRCAARNLLAAGVPQAVAMKITGHKTDSMFRRYAIVSVDQQREALRAAQVYRQQQQERSKVTRIN
ncbi:MAG TPA: site-specific integrase [Terriglobales bacterium]|nr:site-specific integrase [Terriglobales bacterium]